MSMTHRQECGPMRLRHSNASGRGYRRVAAGTGFSYRDLDG